MAIHVMIFGSLSDIAGATLELDNIADTNALVGELNRRFPGLKDSKYVIAVNKKMMEANTELHHNDVVALMPPYSGG
jgi:molybdopterin converting factor small subunit